MPPPRLTALWHSASRLALRPQSRVLAVWSTRSASSTPSSSATAATTASTHPRPIRPSRQQRGRTPRAVVAPVRGYSDSATTRDSQEAENIAAAAAAAAAAASATKAEGGNGEAGAGSDAVLEAPGSSSAENRVALRHLELLSQGLAPFDVHSEGHKFGLTVATTRPAAEEALAAATAAEAGHSAGSLDRNLPGIGKLHDRYDPVVTHMTRVLMRDGKLAKAQRDMAMILNYLKTAPPPKFNPARPLTTGHPSAHEMSLDPVRYLTVAIESVAPLIRIRSFAGAAGGGRPLLVPDPLVARQRRRRVFAWLLEVVNKKPSRGSGRGMLAQRVAEEIIAIVEGRSVLWEKRMLLHKQGISTRANLSRLDMLIKMGQV